MKKIILKLLSIIVFFGCNNNLIVDKEKDKEYLMEIKRVVYYKGSPLTGKLVEYYH